MRGVGWLLAGLFCLGIGLAASAQNVPEPLRGDYRLTAADDGSGNVVDRKEVHFTVLPPAPD